MTLPVLTTRGWRHIRVILATVAVIGLVALHLGSVQSASDPDASRLPSLQADSDDSVPFRSSGSRTFVYDYANILTNQQAERHQFDLSRLDDAGIPTVIYLRRSGDSRNEAIAYATLLRSAWNLESAPEADDGIVILISQSEAMPRRNSLVMSLGTNALPIGQLTTDKLQEIYDREMQPAFRRNEINLALSFGIRRILYYEGYTPPEPPVRTDGQETARTLTPWVLAAAVVFGVVGLLPSGSRGAFLRTVPPWLRSRDVVGGVRAVLFALSAALSLYGRSAVWLAISILAAIVAVLAVRLTVAWRSWRRRGPIVSRVRSRGGRTRAPARRTVRDPRGFRNA